MNNLDAIYDFILNELRKLTLNENFYFKPIKPKLSDLELIAINISAEYLSIDSEYQLFRYLSNSKLNGMIERSVIIAGKENSSCIWKISERLWLIDFMILKAFLL